MKIISLYMMRNNQQVWFSLSAMLLAFWLITSGAVVLAAKMLAGTL